MVSLEWRTATLLVEETKSGREQAISELKKRFTFGRWDVGKAKFGGREVVQAEDESMRVGQPVYLKSQDFVPLEKMRKEQSGDANETEKVAMRSVLGTLVCLACESRPDLSRPFSMLRGSNLFGVLRGCQWVEKYVQNKRKQGT